MYEKQPLIQAFINIHSALRAGLTTLDTTVQRRGRFSNQDLERLQKWFEFYWHKLEMHHHGEDTYFYLEIGKYDAAFLPEMEKLTAEHHELTGLADKIKAAFVRLPQLPADSERDSLNQQFVELISTLNKTLVNHLAVEEAILFPSIAANIPVAAQEAIDQKYAKSHSFNYLANFVPWYMAHLPQQRQAEMAKNAPWIMKFLYYNFWLKKYNRLVASFQI
jgi:hemerythrin-like domain-containing protein